VNLSEILIFPQQIKSSPIRERFKNYIKLGFM
jgi:hypothetical protein